MQAVDLPFIDHDLGMNIVDEIMGVLGNYKKSKINLACGIYTWVKKSKHNDMLREVAESLRADGIPCLHLGTDFDYGGSYSSLSIRVKPI